MSHRILHLNLLQWQKWLFSWCLFPKVRLKKQLGCQSFHSDWVKFSETEIEHSFILLSRMAIFRENRHFKKISKQEQDPKCLWMILTIIYGFSRISLYICMIQSNAVKLVELAKLAALDDLLGKCWEFEIFKLLNISCCGYNLVDFGRMSR